MKQYTSNILVFATILYIALPTQGFRLKRQSELGVPVVGDVASAAAILPAEPDAAPIVNPVPSLPGADQPTEAPPSDPAVGGEAVDTTVAPAEESSDQPGVAVASNGEQVGEPASGVQPSPILGGVDAGQSVPEGVDAGQAIPEGEDAGQSIPEGEDAGQSIQGGVDALLINDPLELANAIQDAIPSDDGKCGVSPLVFLIFLNAPVAP